MIPGSEGSVDACSMHECMVTSMSIIELKKTTSRAAVQDAGWLTVIPVVQREDGDVVDTAR